MRNIEKRRITPSVQMACRNSLITILNGQQKTAKIHYGTSVFHVKIVEGRHRPFRFRGKFALRNTVLANRQQKVSAQHFNTTVRDLVIS